MRIILSALFLFNLLPAWAYACSDEPEEATLEEVQNAPEGYYGVQVKILSLSERPEYLPHNIFTAKAKVLQKFGADIPDTITITFGPCSIIPANRSKHYFLLDSSYNVLVPYYLLSE